MKDLSAKSKKCTFEIRTRKLNKAKRDKIHEAVRTALEKDGWTITDDPLVVQIDDGDRSLEIDLGAERVIAATKGNKKIAVEIKSFSSASILNSFHEALGQYLDYRDALEEGNIEREMYLAVDSEIYKQMENIRFILRRIKKYGLNILLINIESKTILEWKI